MASFIYSTTITLTQILIKMNTFDEVCKAFEPQQPEDCCDPELQKALREHFDKFKFIKLLNFDKHKKEKLARKNRRKRANKRAKKLKAKEEKKAEEEQKVNASS